MTVDSRAVLHVLRSARRLRWDRPVPNSDYTAA